MISAVRKGDEDEGDDDLPGQDDNEGLSPDELLFCRCVDEYLMLSYSYHILTFSIKSFQYARDLGHWVEKSFILGVHPHEDMLYPDFQKMHEWAGTQYPLYIRVMAVRVMRKMQKADEQDDFDARLHAIRQANMYDDHLDEGDDGWDPRHWRGVN